MDKIIINASFKDCIERIIHLKKPLAYKTKTVTKDNSNSKKELTEMFNNCLNFEISDNEIEFEVNKTKEELNKDIDDNKNCMTYSLYRLKKWCNQKVEYRQQITQYLKFKELTWILKELTIDKL